MNQNIVMIFLLLTLSLFGSFGNTGAFKNASPVQAQTAFAPGGTDSGQKPAESLQETALPHPRLILHAGGVVDGQPGTNSKEAFDASYAEGDRYIETDFNWTSDGSLALIHDWEQQDKFCPELALHKAPSEAVFAAAKIMGKYDSMTIGDLAEWLRAHRDVQLITDIKEDNVKALKLIAEKYPDLVWQLIPQIYAYDEYDAVKALGYDRIILTLYTMPLKEKKNAGKVAAFAEEHGLYAVTMDKTLAAGLKSDSPYFTKGITVYAHTVDDPAEAERLTALGIYGVYSDLLLSSEPD